VVRLDNKISVELVDYSKECKAAMKQALIKGLYEAVGELLSQTTQNTKVKTGKTKGSWKMAVDESSLEGYVGSNYENAIYEEYGTGEYALNGDGRKGGWFYKDSSGKWHHTYGKSPRRPLHKAFLSKKNQVINILQRNLQDGMK
jgi:hypothetical protein